MAQVGDILRATHFQTYLGQECLNVFFWRVASLTLASDTPFNWSQEYVADYQQSVLDIQVSQLTFDRVFWENLTDGVEIVDFSVGLSGGETDQPMPSSVALPVILRRASKITRNGYKRFVGMGENQVDGNNNLIGTLQATLLEEFCGEPSVYVDYDGAGNSVTLEPVIVGRTKNAQGVYELDLSKVNDVLSAQMRATVSTQNTRKP